MPDNLPEWTEKKNGAMAEFKVSCQVHQKDFANKYNLSSRENRYISRNSTVSTTQPQQVPLSIRKPGIVDRTKAIQTGRERKEMAPRHVLHDENDVIKGKFTYTEGWNGESGNNEKIHGKEKIFGVGMRQNDDFKVDFHMN